MREALEIYFGNKVIKRISLIERTDISFKFEVSLNDTKYIWYGLIIKNFINFDSDILTEE